MTETFALSPVQRWLWDRGIGRGDAAEAEAVFALGGAAPDAVHRALDAIGARSEILRTRFPIPPGLAVPVQEVGPGPAWTATIADGRLVLRLPALAADRPGLALLAEALRRELAGAPPADTPQYPDIAGWLEDLATGEEGAAGRRFWDQVPPGPADAVVPVPPPGSAEAAGATGAPLPPGLDAVAAAAGVAREVLLLGAWHLLLQRLTGQAASRVAVETGGRDQAMIAEALGPLARWLPGTLALDPRRPLAAALPALAAAVAERRRWQDCTPGGEAPFGFRVEATPPAAGVRLAAAVLPDPPHALRLVMAGDALRIEGAGGAYVLRALLALLEGITAAPGAACGDLPIMPEALRARIVTRFNATDRAWPATDVVALFEAACDHAPDAPAIRHGGASITFATLDARANAVARRLAGLGVGPESRVGLLAPRGPALVEGLLGILKAGAAFVPLDPANPAARRDWIAADAGLAAVVHAPGFAPPPGPPALALDSAGRAGRPGLRPHPDSLAYVLHTSGSTGRPKGVAVPHRGLANYLLWAGEAYRPEEGRGVPVHTSPAFDLTLTALLLPLTRGQWLDLLPEEAPVTALAEGFAARAGWGLVKLTPSHLKAIGNAEVAGGTARLVVGGEALFGEQLAAWAAADPAVEVVNEYGPTETVVGCCVHAAPAGALPPGPMPIGVPIANMRMLALDRHGQPVAPGVAGEAWIGGIGVARGYLGRPDLTADRFRPDPSGPPGSRAYRTGDLVRHRWAGGLDYLGRADDQLKVAGHRIEPAEVEAAILRLQGVDQAAVVQQGDTLVGFVVPVPGAAPTPEALRDGLTASLPPWMVPARLRLIHELPLATSGKADRAALLALPEEATAHVAPRDAREATLAAIWAGVLGREVGVTEDFFRLGGDSIRGLQLVARAKRAGLLLPPDAVFRYPTVAEQALAAEGVPIEEARAEDGAWFPLHPIQAQFLATAGEEAFHEVQSLLLRPDPRPDPATLAQALAAVQRRHGMLRARFGRAADGAWQQRVAPDAPDPAPEMHDLRADPAALPAVGLALKRSLDIEAGPVWRAALIDLPDGPALLLAAHHLVIDRVSWGPVLDDLARALGGAVLDPPPPAYAQWLAAMPPALAAAPTSPVTDLPLDDPGADRGEAAGGQFSHAIPVMPEMAGQGPVLAALSRALAAWTGREAVAIDVEHHGRDAVAARDASQIVGWFTAIATVRLPAGADGAAAREALAAALRRPGSRPSAQVLANHLGAMAEIGGDFAMLPQATGEDRSPLRQRSHPVELVTALAAGCLHCTWRHDARLRPETVARLAQLFERELLEAGAPPAVLRCRLPPGALDAIAARLGAVEAVLPATAAQQGMLYHSALDPSGGAYVEQSVLRFAGELDPEGLRAAWTALVRRHAALRTLFVADENGVPAQIVLRRAEPDWRFEDWRGRADIDAARADLMAADRRDGFDAEAAPPVRFRLLRLGEADWWFLWTRHHAVLDGWSQTPLLGELMALAEGRALPPPPDPVAMADHLARRDAEADRAFWQGRLAGAAPTPLGGRAVTGPARATARHDLRLPAAPLLGFARQAGVTPAALAAAAWGLVLAEGAGRQEALFGMTSSGRAATMPGAETAIGLFLTVLPVRLTLDPAATPSGFLRQLQGELAAMRSHERHPQAELIAAAGLPPGTALATSLLTYENYPTDPSLAAPRPAGPRITAVETVEQSSFPLSLLVGLEGEAMLLSLRYDPARFTQEEVAHRLDRVAAMLRGFATAATLGDLLPLPAAAGFDAGPVVEHPVATPLHALVLEQAGKSPDAPAVLWKEGALTYAALVARARSVAGALQAAGVTRGDVVGLAAERCEALLPALLGILMAGAAWCPLEPDQPPQRLAAMAEDAGLRIVLCGPGITPPAGCRGLPLDAATEASALPALVGADTAYVLFTSGSTGRPKGVAVSHAAIVNRLAWMQRAHPIGAGDRVLHKTPLGFDVCVWELFWPLVAGAAVVVAPPGAHRDPEALAAEMRRQDVGVLHFVPSMLRAFLDAPGIETRCGRPHIVFTSGEALTPDLVAAWRSRFGTALHNLYGPTEAAVDVTAWACGAPEESGEVPIGLPVDNVVVRILDGAMRRVPAGAQGGLWLGGVQLATGYVHAPALTADAFRPDPFGPPGSRLYRTGDLAARRADGALLYRGRSDAQVKLRGVRIETGEVEATLLAHPVVREAAVRLLGDRLVAWVAPAVPADLADFLAARLPAAMRPAVLVPVARMPLTASGKLDRRALAEPALPRGAEALPRGALELRVAALAGEVLGQVPGPHDDLLALGLHSLAAVRLVNLLRRDFGTAPGLGALHAAPTVAALAAALSDAAQATSPVVRLRSGTGKPLVLVHPVGGDVACFLRLAARCDRPVLALQSRGLVDGDAATSVEAMAEDYVAALRTAQIGPVTLAGYSMGCAVAFEMGRRLNGDLNGLVLLDGAAAGAVAELPEDAGALDRARAQGLLPEGFSPEQLARVRAVAAANQRALAAWRPGPADLAATLLRTDPAAGDLGWGAVARVGLTIHDIAAPHAALLDEPHLATVVAILEDAAA